MVLKELRLLDVLLTVLKGGEWCKWCERMEKNTSFCVLKFILFMSVSARITENLCFSAMPWSWGMNRCV